MAKKRKLLPKTVCFRLLESLGWEVGDVEKYIPRTNVRQDLFGFADLLAVKGETTLAVQAAAVRGATTSDVVSHIRKMLAEPRLASCLAAGWLVEVWGVRCEENAAGELIRARSFHLSPRGDRIVVREGSEVLPS